MIMNKLVRLVLALAIALVPTGLLAQSDGTVSGRVVDQATQAPVLDAQVVVVGTQRGAATDAQGRFTITGVPAGTYELRVRRVGYAPAVQRVTVSSGSVATADFALPTSAARLEEVVVNAVTGQTQRRIENGTNSGFIAVGDLNKGPITQMADVLQGRVAGVTLQSASGTQGSSQKIRIRGANSLSLSNEPLLYVDGIRISNGKGGIALGGQDYSRLNDINPEEIENVEILKGPAASAIYGSAAAVGVILITTKRGRAGEPRWNAYAETGSMKDVNKYPLNYAALTCYTTCDPATYYDIPDGGFLNTRFILGASAPYDVCPNYQAAAGTCRQDAVISFDQFRDPRTTPFQSGARAKLGLNVSGGGENLTYYLSGDNEQENGVLRPNNLNRLSFRTNLNANIGHNATAAIRAAYISSNTERISNDNSIFSPLINALLGTAQYIPGMESDTAGRAGSRPGSYFGYNTNDQRKVRAKQAVDRFLIGANTTYTPISWLKMNGNAGLDYYGRFDPQTVNPNELPLALSYIVGFRDATRSRNYQWTASGSATGTFQPFSNLVSNTTLGGSFQRALFETLNCFGIGIPAGTSSCAATTSQFAVDETYTDEKTVGMFARQEFAFADRLFLSASIRGDNNSGLLTDQSGLTKYPSFNASWLISREPFMQRVGGFLSSLRLRTGWGQAGLRPGFGSADTFFGARAVQQAGAEIPALILTRTGNSALKIERTTEFEGGFDAGILNDRVTAEFTGFTRRSKDALISRNLAPSSGLAASVFQNLGSIRNWGTEFGLNANVVDASNFRLDARLTTTTLHNKIEALGAGIAPITFNRGSQAHRQNFPTGAYFARPIKYADTNGDGRLSVSEVQVDTSKFLIVPSTTAGKLYDTLATSFVGTVLPTNTRGISFDVTLFKNITVSTLFEHRGGNKQLNYTEFFRCQTQNANPYYGQCAALSDPNASLAAQAAYIGTRSAFGATPYGYIEDASFTKWRELSVRVGLPESMSSKVRSLKGATVSLSGRNLKTWTNYTGLDPEINESGGTGGAATGGYTQGEFNTQPPVRVFTLRFDLKL
jgi:TonB-linked SusC/RagA family outer membrane protein